MFRKLRRSYHSRLMWRSIYKHDQNLYEGDKEKAGYYASKASKHKQKIKELIRDKRTDKR